jgi:hypothetical protein
MITLFIFPFLLGDFVQKWYIPQGTYWGAGRIIIEDADRDGNYEFYIRTYGGSQKIYIYELHLPDVWEVDSFPYLYSPLIWDIGDFDTDGFSDLVIQASATQTYPTMVISVAESPDSFSYPTQEVWQDTVGFPLVSPICVYDIDQDDIPEIVKIIGDTTDFDVYESVGDNSYARIFRDTIPANYSPMSTVAFGDFDSDAANEFVLGYSGGEYSIWECIGNNTYQEILLQQLPTVNITDCFSVPDADGDGKPEFVVKGFVVPTARINAFIFEATSDNTYEIVDTFDLFGGHNSYYGGYSDVGDVDGDGIPEIALEGCQNIYIIKAAGNDSFYVWETLPGNNSGSSVRVFDIDDNGLAEVIISGNNETRIYEYEVGVAENTPSGIQVVDLSASPNPFREQTVIRYSTRKADHKMPNPILKIYDACGRLVRNFDLESSIMDHASAISWQGDDDIGRNLPGGVYFLTFTSGACSTTEKLILIR